jgi:tRNA(fMet)-specific endonuclease VapC
MRYLLDANVVIALLRDRRSRPAQRLRRQSVNDVAVTAIVLHELYYGVFRSRRIDHNLAIVNALQFPVIDFDREDAMQAGEIRAALAARGQTIGAYDVLIAGQAKARDLILVTHNTAEFGRVAGLQIEDWEI